MVFELPLVADIVFFFNGCGMAGPGQTAGSIFGAWIDPDHRDIRYPVTITRYPNIFSVSLQPTRQAIKNLTASA